MPDPITNALNNPGGALVSAFGGVLKRGKEKLDTGAVPLQEIASPDGNNTLQASGKSYLGDVTLNLKKDGTVIVALDRDGNSTKETLATLQGGSLTVQNTETGKSGPASPAMADALQKFAIDAPSHGITQAEFDGLAAEVSLAANVAIPPKAAAPATAPAGKPKPSRG